MKKCIKCNLLLESDLFYKNKKSKDGLTSYCKKCYLEYNKIHTASTDKSEYYKNWSLENKEKIKDYHKKYYQENKEIYLKRDKERRKTLSYRIWKREYRKKQEKTEKRKEWKKRQLFILKDKYRIWRRLQALVHTKKILREACQVCGEKNTQFHHTDYNKPAEVYHLCDYCHKKAHNNPDILFKLKMYNYSEEYLLKKRGRKSIIK